MLLPLANPIGIQLGQVVTEKLGWIRDAGSSASAGKSSLSKIKFYGTSCKQFMWNSHVQVPVPKRKTHIYDLEKFFTLLPLCPSFLQL
jgi:hypothetical protein